MCSYFSSPADAFPDAKVARDPDGGQGSNQLPAKTSNFLQSIGDHQHSAPARIKCMEFMCLPNDGYFSAASILKIMGVVGNPLLRVRK